MARPSKDQQEARSQRLNLRFTLDEWRCVIAKATAAGLTPTAFCHQAALGSQIEVAPESAPRLSKSVDIAQVVALNRIGVNLNQIARALNSGVGWVPTELESVLERVNALLDDWQEVA